ncbi:PREDICTED: piggyBac transposable element-derived protein 2-like [Diuraphis noxia]|uniref:piggyBac transposable element-derived protein 2-like n=1 Tax=Diuraphis noxia TaxID=143948 RepID=UPI000763AE4A|nr:PREDICTED: piggyBac transposable element-derived protein 2-like [Diuraphis noxia]
MNNHNTHELEQWLLEDFPSDIDTDIEMSDDDVDIEITPIKLGASRGLDNSIVIPFEETDFLKNSANVHSCQPGPSNSSLAIPLDEIDEERDTNLEPTPKRKKNQSCLIKKSKQSNLKKTKPKKNTAPVTEDVTDEYHRIWRKKECKTDVPSYNNSEGPVEDLFLDTTPTSVFLTLFEGILDHIVYQTNLYGTQKNLNLNIKPYEVLNFLGINFLMGYHRLPSWKHYWSCAPDLSVPFVAATMTRNRFDLILTNLHLNDNTLIPKDNKDKLYKLKPLINYLNEKFQLVEVPLKQYNPMKPIKRGYKLWCLADQKGYIKKLQVYQGKDEQLENEFKDCGLGERIENSLACATIRAHRKGIPILHDDSKLARGSTDCKITDSGIGVFKWKDTKSVLLASNYHGTEKTSKECQQKYLVPR